MNAHTRDDFAWIDVGAATDIPRRGSRRLPSPIGDVAVFRTGDGEVFALKDACPHKGGPLSQGIVHGAAVTCPLHGMVLSLESGAALGADEGRVRTIPVRVEGGRLLIQLTARRVRAA